MNTKKKQISLSDIQVFIFDFDGVLTNNLVHIDSNGVESVTCSRSDGLAFDVLKKIGKPAYILSTERNLVVSSRAKKLNITAIQGADNKVVALQELSLKNEFDFKKILYVGNDINDYHVMKLCGYRVCPADSNIKIKALADIVLKSKGGSGVARELLEEVLNIDFIKVLYST